MGAAMEMPTVQGRLEFGNPEHIAIRKKYEFIASGAKEWQVEYEVGNDTRTQVALALNRQDAIEKSGVPEHRVVRVRSLDAIRRANDRKEAKRKNHGR